jgi:hypothetical protein
MRIVPLEAVASQQVTITPDGNRWTLRIKQARGCMFADITLNDELLLRGQRIVAGTPLLPYRYLQGFGNFLLLTNDDLLPDWPLFSVDRVLVYASRAELDAIEPATLSWPALVGYAVETFDEFLRIATDGQPRIATDGQYRIVSI